ncbi:MAG: hypothetical protein LC101_12935 [Flavobacteriales bacterium]|nr:hypothetical protein [Flavobacteriales bacterium]
MKIPIVHFILLTIGFSMPKIMSYAQTFRYEVSTIGIKAGEVEVSRNISNNVEIYHISSNSSVNYVFGKITVINKTSTTYKDNVMQESFLRTDKNGEVDNFCSASYNGKEYKIQTEKDKFTIAGPIKYSITKMYYQEPIGFTEIFSEVYGKMLPVTIVAPHTYSLKQPDGKANVYRYENGVLVEVTVPSPVGKAHIRLKK